MKCRESIFPKEKRWGDIWQKEDEGKPQSIKWTLMKVTTLGVNPNLVVEFGSVPGMLGYEVPRGRSDVLECVLRHRGWDPSQKHHPPSSLGGEGGWGWHAAVLPAAVAGCDRDVPGGGTPPLPTCNPIPSAISHLSHPSPSPRTFNSRVASHPSQTPVTLGSD